MSVHLRPETEARLTALAAASGVSVDDYLAALVEREAPRDELVPSSETESGMIWENGLHVYRTGKPLPLELVNDTVRRTRDERMMHIIGNLP